MNDVLRVGVPYCVFACLFLGVLIYLDINAPKQGKNNKELSFGTLVLIALFWPAMILVIIGYVLAISIFDFDTEEKKDDSKEKGQLTKGSDRHQGQNPKL